MKSQSAGNAEDELVFSRRRHRLHMLGRADRLHVGEAGAAFSRFIIAAQPPVEVVDAALADELRGQVELLLLIGLKL
jgi:hypothetical protein